MNFNMINIRDSLLLQLLHIVWLVCLADCMLGKQVSSAKMAEPIEMPFSETDSRKLREQCLRCGLDPAQEWILLRGH